MMGHDKEDNNQDDGTQMKINIQDEDQESNKPSDEIDNID